MGLFKKPHAASFGNSAAAAAATTSALLRFDRRFCEVRPTGQLGAIGVSGVPSPQDAQIAQAGVEVAAKL